jgi:hypothetical protein
MKRSRTYWIQLCYPDERPDEWLEAFSSYDDTCITAGGLLVKRGAEFALILRPWVKRGSCAAQKDILAELEKTPRPGAKVIRIEL